MKIKSTYPIVLIAGLLAQSTLWGTVVDLDFSGGNGAEFVDQYVGTTGEGWTTSWTGASNNASMVASVSGSENYLSASMTANASGGGYSATVARAFDGTSFGVDVSGVYQLSYSLTVDSSLASGQGYMFFVGSSTGANTSGGNIIQIRGNDGDSGTWLVFNGNKAGGVTQTIDTGVLIENETTYLFTLNIDGANQEYTVSIANGMSTYTSSALGFRASGFSSVDDIYLSWGAYASTGSSTVNFSLDDISAIPEPSTLSYMSAMSIVLLCLMLKRRRSQD